MRRLSGASNPTSGQAFLTSGSRPMWPCRPRRFCSGTVGPRGTTHKAQAWVVERERWEGLEGQPSAASTSYSGFPASGVRRRLRGPFGRPGDGTIPKQSVRVEVWSIDIRMCSLFSKMEHLASPGGSDQVCGVAAFWASGEADEQPRVDKERSAWPDRRSLVLIDDVDISHSHETEMVRPTFARLTFPISDQPRRNHICRRHPRQRGLPGCCKPSGSPIASSVYVGRSVWEAVHSGLSICVGLLQLGDDWQEGKERPRFRLDASRIPKSGELTVSGRSRRNGGAAV